MTGLIRCFIAVELPEHVKSVLSIVQSSAKIAGIAGLRWVEPQGIHLTLKFLGDLPDSHIGKVGDALNKVVSLHSGFSLHTTVPGFFPNRINPRVCWIGLSGQLDRLELLQTGIEAAMVRLGFQAERRPFEAHLTIGRVRDGVSSIHRKKLVEGLSVPNDMAGTMFRVKSVSLIQSQLLPEGARYSRLLEASLDSRE